MDFKLTAIETSHLTFFEYGAYCRMMVWCDATGRSLPADQIELNRIMSARTKAARETVLVVLREFFEQKDDGWTPKRRREENSQNAQQDAHQNAQDAQYEEVQMHKINECKSTNAQVQMHKCTSANAQDALVLFVDEGGVGGGASKANTSNQSISQLQNQLQNQSQLQSQSQLPTLLKDEQVAESEKKQAVKKINSVKECSEDFQKFWKNFPRKKNWPAALRAWNKIKPTASDVVVILESLERYKQSHDWIKEGGRWRPLPATWLNACGWDDDAGDQHGYSDAALGVMAAYNDALPPVGWPPAESTPFVKSRAVAIDEFLSGSERRRQDHGAGYFDFAKERIEPRPGLGFDWLIKPETVLRMREGNFSGLGNSST